MKSESMPFSRRLAWVIVAIHVAALTGRIQLPRLGGALWSIGFLAYLLGMRHAFDVDHIAAIDNVPPGCDTKDSARRTCIVNTGINSLSVLPAFGADFAELVNGFNDPWRG